MKKLWNTLVNWFEYGDLVPLLVIVSAVHYAGVLADHDQAIVAIAIGLLVDLGHFRTVRAAVRYSGADRRQAAARWLIALALTAISLAYHQRYYGDWWLSVPLPLLIAALAWLQRVDQHVGQRSKPVQPSSQPAVSAVVAEHSQLERPQQPRLPAARRYTCDTCGRGFASQQGCNAHQRVHIELGPPLPVERLTSNGHK